MNTHENSRYSKGEELANAISHLAGTLLAITALVLLVVRSVQIGTGWHIVSSSVFGASMVILYFSSTMTHWLQPGKAKEVFFTLDQVAIFLLIAGTYTPFTLVALHGPLGWVIFGLEWGLAIIGITIKLTKPTKFNAGVNMFYILLYAAMGWMLLIALVPIFKSVSQTGVLWILAGGLCYTIGIFFYRKARFKYHHLVWHILVLAGTISHFVGIYYFVIPISI
ncbi:MAG: hemolysin III family protein [Bacteroidetes bacterium]|jgi:hemolysin III|nr:hemolysin III family protein [Bacteroidota bacterium]MBT4399962.1 hemolysin III family protein [Bacteroidota bacterium]MBT4409068.1 hemolysin III family protein [Bacteroidota bacterium]MBT5426902.1 hemolysin III family protein [Bacteroidota bacterium]MBT7095006.1 hemolysin III family protein [Bacteroidota bacterium]